MSGKCKSPPFALMALTGVVVLCLGSLTGCGGPSRGEAVYAAVDADTEVLIELDFPAIWTAPLVQRLREDWTGPNAANPIPFEEGALKPLGITLEDLGRIVIALPTGTIDGAGNAGVFAIEIAKPIPVEIFGNYVHTRVGGGGRDVEGPIEAGAGVYYQWTRREGTETIAAGHLESRDGTVLVIGTPERVIAAVERGTGELGDALGRAGAHLGTSAAWLSIRPSEALSEQMTNNLDADPDFTPQERARVRTLVADMTANGLSLSLGEGIAWQLWLAFGEEANAEEFAKVMDRRIQEARNKPDAAPAYASLRESLNVTRNGAETAFGGAMTAAEIDTMSQQLRMLSHALAGQLFNQLRDNQPPSPPTQSEAVTPRSRQRGDREDAAPPAGPSGSRNPDGETPAP